ncbi:MAG: hypothetical protein CM15mV3_2360 [Caudoviricetes sp.]|nr:MAG: hypothetical protein CM15mV3_2360 [Caudoviricetes sp.]
MWMKHSNLTTKKVNIDGVIFKKTSQFCGPVTVAEHFFLRENEKKERNLFSQTCLLPIIF